MKKMNDFQSKKQAIEEAVDEMKLIALQLKWCKKHFDIWFPLAMKLSEKAFEIAMIKSQPVFPKNCVEYPNGSEIKFFGSDFAKGESQSVEYFIDVNGKKNQLNPPNKF
jgi:hypothetical protein